MSSGPSITPPTGGEVPTIRPFESREGLFAEAKQKLKGPQPFGSILPPVMDTVASMATTIDADLGFEVVKSYVQEGASARKFILGAALLTGVILSPLILTAYALQMATKGHQDWTVAFETRLKGEGNDSSQNTNARLSQHLKHATDPIAGVGSTILESKTSSEHGGASTSLLSRSLAVTGKVVSTLGQPVKALNHLLFKGGKKGLGDALMREDGFQKPAKKEAFLKDDIETEKRRYALIHHLDDRALANAYPQVEAYLIEKGISARATLETLSFLQKNARLDERVDQNLVDLLTSFFEEERLAGVVPDPQILRVADLAIQQGAPYEQVEGMVKTMHDPDLRLSPNLIESFLWDFRVFEQLNMAGDDTQKAAQAKVREMTMSYVPPELMSKYPKAANILFGAGVDGARIGATLEILAKEAVSERQMDFDKGSTKQQLLQLSEVSLEWKARLEQSREGDANETALQKDLRSRGAGPKVTEAVMHFLDSHSISRSQTDPVMIDLLVAFYSDRQLAGMEIDLTYLMAGFFAVKSGLDPKSAHQVIASLHDPLSSLPLESKAQLAAEIVRLGFMLQQNLQPEARTAVTEQIVALASFAR